MLYVQKSDEREGETMENDSLPQYMQIALSIAGRIAGGDVPEGAKISGRSKLSSEYNVSPETIRKAVVSVKWLSLTLFSIKAASTFC